MALWEFEARFLRDDEFNTPGKSKVKTFGLFNNASVKST